MNANILVVDDSPLMRKMICKTIKLSSLESAGIFEGANGEDALRILEKENIDLVISDIHMPEMDGVRLIEEIRGSDKYRQLPVMILSSEGSDVMMEQLQASGIENFIQKPFSPESLRDALEELDLGL